MKEGGGRSEKYSWWCGVQVAIQRAMGYEGCVAEGGDEKYACKMDKVGSPSLPCTG
jgi:hypothetical protein